MLCWYRGSPGTEKEPLQGEFQAEVGAHEQGAGTSRGTQGSWDSGQGFRAPTTDAIFLSLSQGPMVLDPEDTLASDGRLGLWARVTEGAGLQEGLRPRHSRGVWSRGHSYIHCSAVSWCAAVSSSDTTCKVQPPAKLPSALTPAASSGLTSSLPHR